LDLADYARNIVSNPNKAKGSAAERAVADYLNVRGFEAERVPAGSNLDRGDIWVPEKSFPAIQVKNHARLDLSGWVDDVAIQARNAGRETGIVIHKRRGKGNPASWYVTCTLDTLITIIEGAKR
jgi:Holliday junction resolvase